MTQQVVNLSDTVRLKRTRRRKTDARGEDHMSWTAESVHFYVLIFHSPHTLPQSRTAPDS